MRGNLLIRFNVVSYPPLAGVFTSNVAELEIIKLIRAGDQYDTQLFTVRVLTSTHDLPSDTDLLVKLYDPLYFDHEQDDVDPFLYVDRAYTHESAVYTKLADFQGSTIPSITDHSRFHCYRSYEFP